MLKIFVSLLLLSLSLVTLNAKVAIQKCKASDSACILASSKDLISSIINGIPEYHIPPLNLVTLEPVDASTPNLKLLLNDIKVRGFDTCKAQEMRRDAANKKIFGKLLCDLQAEGLYEMKGKLLVLPIEGNGNAKVVANKILISFELEVGEKTTKDGKFHWTIKNWNYKYELKDRAIVKFDNLFPGNKELSQATEEVISKNGNEIIAEVGEPLLKAGVEKLLTFVALLFKNRPVEDLVLDD